MKFFSAIVLGLFLLAGSAHAQQSADSQYITIYGLIQQADNLSSNGQLPAALSSYLQAQKQLQQFQTTYPDWDAAIINYRLGDLAAKIAELQAKLPKTDTNNPAPAPAPGVATPAPAASAMSSADLQALQAQLQAALEQNATLQAKLKEALSPQPSAVDTATLAAAQEQVRALMKENELLKSVANNPQDRQPESRQVAELKREVAGLRARITTDEAAPTPYTPEELSLLQLGTQSGTQLNTNSAPPAASLTMPADAADLAASAQQHFVSHEYAAAEADYRKILKLHPDNAYVLGNLATVEIQENKLDVAEKNIQLALTQTPNDAFDLGTLGKIKFSQGKFDDALTILSRAAQLNPDNPEIQNYLGVAYGQKGLRQQAETALRKAVELAPNYAPAHNNLAVMYLNETPSLPQLARWHYEKALAAGQPRDTAMEQKLAEQGAPVSAAQ